MRILPTKPSNFPFFILIYWLLIWLFIVVIIYINLSSHSIDGYIPTKDCIREKENVCVLFSAFYKVPIWQEFAIQAFGLGIIIGAISILFGYGKMMLILSSQK